eukprot:4553232-Pyramimonas_sp.AAC.1
MRNAALKLVGVETIQCRMLTGVFSVASRCEDASLVSLGCDCTASATFAWNRSKVSPLEALCRGAFWRLF